MKMANLDGKGKFRKNGELEYAKNLSRVCPNFQMR